MCGIFGIVGLNRELDTHKLNIPNSTDVLKHRGPDDYGHYLNSHVYLGHRRLSIIDLSTGKQPIFNENMTKVVIFNGEIYNFNDIRQELKIRGHQFNSKTDTEVIVHAYEEWGYKCLEKFRGMFAFALWDSEKRTLFLARDRLGIKPVFYAEHEGYFYFGSEIKSIIQYSYFPRNIDKNALAAYFSLSYIPAPLTIFDKIKKLLPGHYLEISKGSIKETKYWDIYFEPDRRKKKSYFIDGFLGLLEEAVQLRMISDVPVGAFLSGGIDSGTVVALMSRQSADPIRSFCMGFGGEVGGYLDERRFARQVATRFGTIHKEYEVQPSVSNIMDDIVSSFDEPFADHSTIPSYYLCELTRKDVTVALSGLGGDEVFGGYERYLGFKYSSYYQILPRLLRDKFIKELIEKIPERANGHYTLNHLKRFVRSASLPEDTRYYGFLTIMGKEGDADIFANPDDYVESMDYCRQLILNYFNSPNALEALDKVFYCDMKTYLPEDILALTDRISMRHSLEVRVPFLDHKLLEFCAKIPNEKKVGFKNKKAILKKAVKKLLPPEVIAHRKQGFVGPMTYWLRTDLKKWAMDVLNEKNLNKHGLINPAFVNKILTEHFNRFEIRDKIIWALINFQLWFDKYIDNKTI